ncbi:MAG: hypothetical protein HY606_07080 [Planctomycetes bacterium]|nr:hypothetical protein [Planctomycetota bacterium]
MLRDSSLVLKASVVVLIIQLLIGCASNEQDLSVEVQEHTHQISKLMTQQEIAQEQIGKLADSVKTLLTQIHSFKLELQSLRNSYVDLEKRTLKLEGTSKTATDFDIKSILPDLLQEMAKIRSAGQDDIKSIKSVSEKYKEKADIILPYLLEEMKTNVTDWGYIDKLKKLVSMLPPDKITFGLKNNLEDLILRTLIIDIVSKTKDYQLSKILEEIAFKNVEEALKTQLGDALTECRNEFGAVLFIELLSSEADDHKFFAIVSLKKITGGDSFEYDYRLDSKRNANSINKWKEWYQSNKGNLFSKKNG